MTTDSIFSNPTLGASEWQYLRRIGLSKTAITLYELLLQNDSLTAQEAAGHMHAFAAAQYRLFYELEQKGLVRQLPGRPRRFRALDMHNGLQASLAKEEKQLETLVVGDAHLADDQATILVGRQAAYETGWLPFPSAPHSSPPSFPSGPPAFSAARRRRWPAGDGRVSRYVDNWTAKTLGTLRQHAQQTAALGAAAPFLGNP